MTFIKIEHASIGVEKRPKHGPHTLHKPSGVAITVLMRTTISPGQVSSNYVQLFLPLFGLISMAWPIDGDGHTTGLVRVSSLLLAFSFFFLFI